MRRAYLGARRVVDLAAGAIFTGFGLRLILSQRQERFQAASDDDRRVQAQQAAPGFNGLRRALVAFEV